jgi:5-methylthioadenosine/S-adenosylhomocysteine deaminase
MSSILIKNGVVIPVDGNKRSIENGYVTIENDKITSVGKMGDLKNKGDYEIVIDAKRKAVLPGFVNAHTHLATECFRGIVDLFPGTHFTFVVKNFFEEKHIYDLGLLGCLELIRFGTTCTGDNYQWSRIIARTLSDSGLRGVLSEQISQSNLLEGIYPAIYKYQPEVAEKEIEANEKLIKEWNGANNGRIRCAFGPHAPDTLTQDILLEIKSKADEHGVGIMIHIAQSPRELQMMRLRHRMTSVEYLAEAGILGPNTIGAHCVYLTQKDLEIFKKSGTHIAHCPNNFIRRGRNTPLMPWLKAGIKTIGIASDNILHDPFELMRFTQYLALQYVQQVDPESLHFVPTSYEILEMATMGSAKGLGLADEIGSLEKGKKADLIIIDLEKPHLTPSLDIISNLVHYANGNDVETTIIDGKIVMDNRKINTVKEADVLKKGEKASIEVWQAFHDKFRQFPEISQKLKYFQ